jgi:hypothetical protein
MADDSFVDRYGGLDNPLVALGLALAGGRTPQEGMAGAANALQYRQALLQRQRQAELAGARDARDFAFRQSESGRAQSNADRAFEFQRQQAELAGKGYEYRTDPDSGQLIRIDRQSGTATAVPVEGAAPPGNPYAYPGKPMTEAQGKDSTYATRMFSAERVLRDPAVISAGSDLTQRGRAKVPLVGNYLTSENYQSYDQAARDFVNAALRRESGAAISQSEFDNAYKQYLPQPGDSEKVLAQKQRNRVNAIKSIAGAAGRGYRPPYTFDESGNISGASGASGAPAAPSAPSRADVEAEMRRRGLLK